MANCHDGEPGGWFGEQGVAMKSAETALAADTQATVQAATLVSSQHAIASMRQHGIAFTADNYAVWHCYLTGSNLPLRRAIDIVLSNGLAIDDRTLRILYARHFCETREALALRDLAQRSIETLAELRHSARPDLVEQMLDRLDQDMQEMIGQSERMTRLLTRADERIVQLERCLDDARQEASTDALTGVANRRAFDAALHAMAGDAMNDGSDLAFVLIDIDHFKRVNDRWGHPVGDEVLRMIAAALVRTVRGKDLVARYGGEEFAVILPVTDQRGATLAAENLRAAVEQQSLKLPASDVGSIRVTISAGASCYDHGESLSGWLARADGALYVAKNAGRNRVAFGEALPPGEAIAQIAGGLITGRGCAPASFRNRSAWTA